MFLEHQKNTDGKTTTLTFNGVYLGGYPLSFKNISKYLVSIWTTKFILLCFNSHYKDLLGNIHIKRFISFTFEDKSQNREIFFKFLYSTSGKDTDSRLKFQKKSWAIKYPLKWCSIYAILTHYLPLSGVKDIKVTLILHSLLYLLP